MSKLVFVVLYVGEQRLDAVVVDSGGKRRRVEYSWHSKEPTLMPADWYSSVEGEAEYQRAEEVNKAKGRSFY